MKINTDTKKNMKTDTDTQTGRGKLLSARELMAEINVSHAWLRKQGKAGMPRVCLNPESANEKGRRYRYSLGAVLAWLEGRNTAEVPAEKKGVEA